MEEKRIMHIDSMALDKEQIKRYLSNMAISHELMSNSEKETYPIPRLIENFEVIKIIYNLLNNNLKQEITLYPAAEWLLDNFYIIEETVKTIKKELTLKKYKNFVGIKSGQYKGFARIYVLASEIVAYTDNKIEKMELEEYLGAYQNNKYLNMDEIWNLGIFLQISIIENIRLICEKIYMVQMQKIRANEIINKYFEKKNINQIKLITENKIKKEININKIDNSKYPFIEYLSYCLKKYGKKGIKYLQVLEEIANRAGTTISEAIEKEHYDIAVKKISIGNSITSIKVIKRINFNDIFEKINGVEEILKNDPARVYPNMDYKTKEYYRNEIKKIGLKTKISEIYIAKKLIELANNNNLTSKESHIGYYLIDNGKKILYKELGFKYKSILNENKMKIYIFLVIFFTFLISILLGIIEDKRLFLSLKRIITVVLLIIPISEIVIQIMQYMLSKIVKQKIIPKIDLKEGIDKENATMVVIPTIVKNRKKVKELAHKLEVYYLANKTENLFFTILGDCSESKSEFETFDNEIIDEGLKQVKILNRKYGSNNVDKFFFIYRKRRWNEKENSYIGWERKRGLLNQFNKYLLGEKQGDFLVNTIENYSKTFNIKYVITLDSDTDLPLDTAKELVGTMSHILNKPIISKNKKIITSGYGIIQPRVGVKLEESNKNIFTKIFAGQGGTDLYANAISDIYQDNFGEGIYTGKGIYDLKTFEAVLNNEIPENTVLSHDLLEGCYLRCGLASDILLMDDTPSKYLSFINRQARWIRGDWQIAKWLNNKKINIISKYKIFDNLRRSLLEIFCIICLFYFRNNPILFLFSIFPIILPNIIELLNYAIFKKDGEKYQKTFTKKMGIIRSSICRAVLLIGTLPYKALISFVSICKAIYRTYISHKKMLQWTTSEEVEKISKTDFISYYKSMIFNVILGVLMLYYSQILGILWIIIPGIMFYISKTKVKNKKINEINKKEKEYLFNIAKKTWNFFEDYLTEENNFLIPDNYQEDRTNLIVNRTSSTNIGLSIIAVISAFDLKFISKNRTIFLLENIINTIIDLPKWNGHLYNWYSIKEKKPIFPRYVSTVDSGNYVGYLYIVKGFCESILKKYNGFNREYIKNKYKLKNKKYLGKVYKLKDLKIFKKQINQIKYLIDNVNQLIEKTDFSVLYNKESKLFSIGFNIEENKLTDSYYDLLASEARQASLIAIAKRDIPVKHWRSLSRTLTVLGDYKGLISWSGTAFEYLMPNINIPVYEGSLIDESCRFMIMCQQKYAKQLGIPWGISESAFNLKDLHSNYQYKAFGIPWLGLKRGLADEIVVSSYGSILALNYTSKDVIKNLRVLDKNGMVGKYGFYESIDYTPERQKIGKTYSIVKTYMAHHQALILLSINNFINENILQKRFIRNPEIEGIKILLQERIPETYIITKETKEKIEKIRYINYDDYAENKINKITNRIIRGNVIGNENYMVAIDQAGRGYSKYEDVYINRYKKTSDENQGIFFYVRDIKSNNILKSIYDNQKKYSINFMPDKIEQEIEENGLNFTQKIIVSPNDPVELRRLEITNNTNEEKKLEVISTIEPILSTKEQDYAHQAFNNLFLITKYDEESKCLITKRKKRGKNEKNICLVSKMCADVEEIGNTEFEIDKEKLMGRGNLFIPKMIDKGLPFTQKLGLAVEPIIAIKKIIKVKPGQTANIKLILSVEIEEKQAIENMKKYEFGDIKRIFEISKVISEAQNRYLEIGGQDIKNYQRIISYILFDNPLKQKFISKCPNEKYYQSDLWKYGISGDLPIILVKLKDTNDIYVLKEMLRLFEYIRYKNIFTELVILNQEKYSYENYLKDEIEKTILNKGMSYLKNVRGGIFILSEKDMIKKDINTISFVAELIFDGHLGNLKSFLDEMEEDELGR